MSTSVCRRVYVNFGNSLGRVQMTLWQPAFKLACARETIFMTGLTVSNFLPSVLSDDDPAVPSAPIYVKCSATGYTVSNGSIEAESSGDYDGWLVFNAFDPALGISVTTTQA